MWCSCRTFVCGSFGISNTSVQEENNVCEKLGFMLVVAWKYYSNKMRTRLVLHDEVRCELITFYTEYGTSHVLVSLSLLDSQVSFMGRCWKFRLSTLVAVCIRCSWMKDIVAKIDLFSGDICYGSVKPWTVYLPTEDLLFLFSGYSSSSKLSVLPEIVLQ